MTDDHRIVKLEGDVAHLRADMDEVKQDIRATQASVDGLRTEFYSFRIEVAKEFGSFRAEVAKQFGAVYAQIESVKTSIESVKTLVERYARLAVIWALSTVVTLIGLFATFAHALKWF